MRVLLTGGCGFVGHHFCEGILKRTDWDIIILDKLNYASSGFDRLRDIQCFDEKRVLVLSADLVNPISEGLRREIGEVDYILHLAAESSVDKSIANPEPFILSNVLGTMRILDFARTQKSLKFFSLLSTDECFGPAPEGVQYSEWDRYNCTNPYAASKAGAEQLCLAYANCYKLPLFIATSMNIFGERQHPEKFIPMTIRKVLAGETVLIHSDPTRTKPGSRFWIHARNVLDAVLFLLERAEQRERYNIVGEREVDNLSMAKFIAKVIGKELKYELIDFHSSRPGHDLRYALSGERMKKLGWTPPKGFEESLEKTIRWTLENLKVNI